MADTTSPSSSPSLTNPVSSSSTKRQPSTKPLSCTSCRRKKIKCNKVHPCQPCLKSGDECILPTRRSAPAKGRRRDKEELLRRISRLESFVNNASQALGPEQTDVLYSKEAEKYIKERQRLDAAVKAADPNPTDALIARYNHFIKLQEAGPRHPTRDFWQSLSDEFDGLKQLLEGTDSEDEEDEESKTSPRIVAPLSNSYSSFVFGQAGNGFKIEDYYPTRAYQLKFFHYYNKNVNDLFNMSHSPTAMIHVRNAIHMLDPETKRYRFGSLEAIAFTMAWSAVTSMTPEQCISELGEERDVMCERYRRCAERALADADFLNSIEIVTLKAFVLYIITLRYHDKSRASWSLLGLAIRVARGLALHREGSVNNFIPFETENRRRLWWLLMLLDLEAAEDRGTDPMIVDGTYDCLFPSNIEDEDMGLETLRPMKDRKGLTQMSLTCILMDASNTNRKINFLTYVSDSENSITPKIRSIKEKETLIKDCTDRIENIYLYKADTNDPKAWLLSMIARLLVLKLWLLTQYPLQNVKSEHYEAATGQSLRTAVAYLYMHDMIETHEVSKPYSWWFETHVPWHPLAVALVELCTDNDEELTRRAWAIIDKCYKKWSERAADGPGGILWKPIKNLLKKARAKRYEGQSPMEDIQSPDERHKTMTPPSSVSSPQSQQTGLPLRQTEMEPVLQSVPQLPAQAPPSIMQQATLQSTLAGLSSMNKQDTSGPAPSKTLTWLQDNPQPMFKTNIDFSTTPDFFTDLPATPYDLNTLQGALGIPPVEQHYWNDFMNDFTDISNLSTYESVTMDGLNGNFNSNDNSQSPPPQTVLQSMWPMAEQDIFF